MTKAEDLEASRVNIFLHAENVRVFGEHERPVLPTCLVTGFLGAGKTTLLNHILSNGSNLRIAAAINDFAELNIDEDLVRSKDTASKLVELSNGCVCCHLLDDLQDAVFKMLESGGDVERDAVNYLMVETSGVSDPLHVIRTLDAKFGKCFRARLDSVVTVVDSDQLAFHAPSDAAISQLACADIVIMNKIDLLKDKSAADLVESRIQFYNSDAVIHKANHCNVPLSAILDVDVPPPTDSTSGGNAITHESSQMPVYISATGGSLRRPTSSIPAKTSKRNSANTALMTHLKRDKFTSVSVTIESEPISLLKLQNFICSPLVQNLSRMKGVLWIQGMDDYRCVIHLSGRGRLGFELDGKWSGPPTSTIAFIGSNLNPDEIKTSFSHCTVNALVKITTMDFSHKGLDVLKSSKEFQIFEDVQEKEDFGSHYFRLTGSEVYGYKEEEIERNLRIDTDEMNIDLADAVNASVDRPKAFLAYKRVTLNGGESKLVLCYAGGLEPANNIEVLLREAIKVLSVHFRNVQVCQCGT
mmetsp:Transcript_12322/g.17189  ORF Transcript_12322/g.17189 Transcript_12322/m.17189 type:complete len:528 (+) Transcript_12322:51-1634(+)